MSFLARVCLPPSECNHTRLRMGETPKRETRKSLGHYPRTLNNSWSWEGNCGDESQAQCTSAIWSCQSDHCCCLRTGRQLGRFVSAPSRHAPLFLTVALVPEPPLASGSGPLEDAWFVTASHLPVNRSHDFSSGPTGIGLYRPVHHVRGQ